jgi:Na+-driven multidrug efflux pump
MNFKKVLISFFIGFVVTLIASSLVTYLYSLGFHETAKINWETSFQLAIIFGIIFPVMEARKERPDEKQK